jgi:hypothetical protein
MISSTLQSSVNASSDMRLFQATLRPQERAGHKRVGNIALLCLTQKIRLMVRAGGYLKLSYAYPRNCVGVLAIS